MSTDDYPEHILTALDAINHNVRLLQSLIPPWPKHFHTFREAKQWALVQCMGRRVEFAKFPNKSHHRMRENVLYRATLYAKDAGLFTFLKTGEGAITDPVVDRTNRSNIQNSVMPRDGKGMGNEMWNSSERARQGNAVQGLVHNKALEAQRNISFPGEDDWPPTFDSEEAAQAWIEKKLKLTKFTYGKCPRGGRGNKWWREEVRCRIILNAGNAGFCSITPPGKDESSTDTAEDSEESDSSGGILISFQAQETIKDDKTESNTAQSSNRDDALDGYPPTTRYNSIHNDTTSLRYQRP